MGRIKDMPPWELVEGLVRAAKEGVSNAGVFADYVARAAELSLLDGADANGMTALGWAVWNDHVPCAQALVDAGAGVRQQDEDGQTPLFNAAHDGSVDLVEVLLAARGVEVDVADAEGETPLAAASARGHVDTVKLLCAAGGDPLSVDHEGLTPLLKARRGGHAATAEFLQRFIVHHTRATGKVVTCRDGTGGRPDLTLGGEWFGSSVEGFKKGVAARWGVFVDALSFGDETGRLSTQPRHEDHFTALGLSGGMSVYIWPSHLVANSSTVPLSTKTAVTACMGGVNEVVAEAAAAAAAEAASSVAASVPPFRGPIRTPASADGCAESVAASAAPSASSSASFAAAARSRRSSAATSAAESSAASAAASAQASARLRRASASSASAFAPSRSASFAASVLSRDAGFSVADVVSATEDAASTVFEAATATVATATPVSAPAPAPPAELPAAPAKKSTAKKGRGKKRVAKKAKAKAKAEQEDSVSEDASASVPPASCSSSSSATTSARAPPSSSSVSERPPAVYSEGITAIMALVSSQKAGSLTLLRQRQDEMVQEYQRLEDEEAAASAAATATAPTPRAAPASSFAESVAAEAPCASGAAAAAAVPTADVAADVAADGASEAATATTDYYTGTGASNMHLLMQDHSHLYADDDNDDDAEIQTASSAAAAPQPEVDASSHALSDVATAVSAATTSVGGEVAVAASSAEHGEEAEAESVCRAILLDPDVSMCTQAAEEEADRRQRPQQQQQHRVLPDEYHAGTVLDVEAAGLTLSQLPPPVPPQRSDTISLPPSECGHSPGALAADGGGGGGGFDDDTAAGDGLVTPLHQAAVLGEAHTAAYLIGEGYSVESRDEKGRTPLIWAAIGGHLKVVKLLLDSGARHQTRDVDGCTAVFHSAVNGKNDLLAWFAANVKGAGFDSLDAEGHSMAQWAAYKGYLSTLRYLVEVQKVRVDVPDFKDKLAVHWAARMGRCDVLRYLIQQGSPVFLQDVDGCTPEDHAIETRQWGAVTVLREARLQIEGANESEHWKKSVSKAMQACKGIVASHASVRLPRHASAPGAARKQLRLVPMGSAPAGRRM